MSDLRQTLDQLDAAHLPAWRGELRVGEHYGIHLYGGHDGQEPIGTALRPRDADRIVADCNAVPRLTAALRAVLDLADEMEAPVAGLTGPVGPLAPLYDGRDVAFRIRAALSGADTGTTA